MDIQHISQLLGHHSISATTRYLRLDISKAQQLAIDADMLADRTYRTINKSSQSSPAHQSLTDDQIDALMIEFAEFLKSKYSNKKG